VDRRVKPGEDGLCLSGSPVRRPSQIWSLPDWSGHPGQLATAESVDSRIEVW